MPSCLECKHEKPPFRTCYECETAMMKGAMRTCETWDVFVPLPDGDATREFACWARGRPGVALAYAELFGHPDGGPGRCVAVCIEARSADAARERARDLLAEWEEARA